MTGESQNSIVMIPADNDGNKLFLKDFRINEKKKMFVCYRSTYNDIPFQETEIFAVDGGKNIAICADDGTVLFRVLFVFIEKLIS